MRHRFAHEFDDDPKHGDFDVDLSLPDGARIRFDAKHNDIWLSANKAGWLHLAKMCAEMAMHSQFKGGYHFHRAHDWKESSELGNEVSFELADDESN